MWPQKGETLMTYINAEETAYRQLQRVLEEAMGCGQDEYSYEGKTSNTTSKKFQLPKRLCGLLFMGRSQITIKEHSGTLNMTQGLNIDKLKKVMTESLPEQVPKYIDGRTATKPPWQPKQGTEPFKQRFGTRYVEDGDDAHAL